MRRVRLAHLSGQWRARSRCLLCKNTALHTNSPVNTDYTIENACNIVCNNVIRGTNLGSYEMCAGCSSCQTPAHPIRRENTRVREWDCPAMHVKGANCPFTISVPTLMPTIVVTSYINGIHSVNNHCKHHGVGSVCQTSQLGTPRARLPDSARCD